MTSIEPRTESARASGERKKRLRGLSLPKRRGQHPRGLPFDLKKALFILPNAFTVSSIFCGLYAILQASTEEAGGLALYQAAIAIFFAGFFDMFDGRVARLTKTQSDFGVQMDSLADVISFGVAPSVLVYKWALQPLGAFGMFASFAFASCGAIRLARFNVLAQRGIGSSRYFVGLPIPVAAAMLVALVIAHHFTLGSEVESHRSVVALVLVLCYLMVSNIRYQTFKDFRPTPKTLPLIALLAAVGVATSVLVHPSAALVVFIGGYIFWGLLENAFRYPKERRELRQAAATHAEPRESEAHAG